MATGIYDAIKQNDLLRLGLLIRDYNPSKIFPLHYAAVHGTQEAISLLIDAGFDMNLVQDGGQETPLTRSISHRQDEEIVKFLIKSGANVNQVLTYTPLMVACNCHMSNFIDLLIEHGADIDLQSSLGTTALMYCAFHGLRRYTGKLLQRGANVNLQDRNGDTALHIALREDDAETARMLIRRRANLNLKNDMGHMPLDMARMHLRSSEELKEIEALLVS